MYRFRPLVWACALSLMATYAFAQTSSLNGRVADLRGGVVANAEVSLRTLPPPGAAMPNMPNMRQNEPPPRTTRTGADGAFTFEQLPAGTYRPSGGRAGFGRASQEVTIPTSQAVAVAMEPLELIGAEAAPRVSRRKHRHSGAPRAHQALEQRLTEFESHGAVRSRKRASSGSRSGSTRTASSTDQPVPGAKREVTYQRERAYRRQTINEKIEEALADERTTASASAWTPPPSRRPRCRAADPKPTPTAIPMRSRRPTCSLPPRLAQHTIFFADVVALSGSPPDREIPSLTLLNGYTARLVNQNELNLREAWLRTEFFGQRLALIAGRLDLTNYFDHNAAANDETTQFISDALVNNPTLGSVEQRHRRWRRVRSEERRSTSSSAPAEQPGRDEPVGFDLLARRSRLRGQTAVLGGRQLPGRGTGGTIAS